MKIFKKVLLTSVITGIVMGVNINAKVLNDKNPEGFKEYRLDYAEMVELANPNRLAFRVFYDKPSQGPYKEWFDAVKKGDLETVKKIVESGQYIDVTDEASAGQTALGWAAFIGYEDIVDYLIEKGANLQAPDRGDVANVLKSAALGNNVNVFKKIYNLMKDQVDINDQKQDKQGETLLIAAAGNDRREIVAYLLELGADGNLSTTKDEWWKAHPAYNENALSYACKMGHTEVAKMLIEKGAINLKTGKPSCE